MNKPKKTRWKTTSKEKVALYVAAYLLAGLKPGEMKKTKRRTTK